MKAIARTLTKALAKAICIAVSVAGCVTPVDPGEEIEEDVTWELHILNYTMKVDKDCDRDIGGIGNAGEFSYKMSYELQNVSGSWAGQILLAESSGFGTSDGSSKKIKSGGKLEIPSRRTVTQTEGLGYRLHFSAIEWDGSDRDDRMKGGTAMVEEITGTAGINSFRDVNVPLGTDANCKVTFTGVVQEIPIG